MPNDPFVDIAALPLLGPVHYLDARDRAMFDAGHAPGAVRVRVEEWDAAAKAAETGFNKTAYWMMLSGRSVSIIRHCHSNGVAPGRLVG
jgi:rhodanese-related sulfurtransferase